MLPKPVSQACLVALICHGQDNLLACGISADNPPVQRVQGRVLPIVDVDRLHPSGGLGHGREHHQVTVPGDNENGGDWLHLIIILLARVSTPVGANHPRDRQHDGARGRCRRQITADRIHWELDRRLALVRTFFTPSRRRYAPAARVLASLRAAPPCWDYQLMTTAPCTELLLISGRSGVGKSAVAAELHHLLAQADVKHALIEGDNLDLAHPPPWEYGLAETNLRSIWHNYQAVGYRRLIYVNTVSALFEATLTEALGGPVDVTSILLTADDASVGHRLRLREVGSALDLHLQRSRDRAHELDAGSPASVHRISTDSKSVTRIAREILDILTWTPDPPS